MVKGLVLRGLKQGRYALLAVILFEGAKTQISQSRFEVVQAVDAPIPLALVVNHATEVMPPRLAQAVRCFQRFRTGFG